MTGRPDAECGTCALCAGSTSRGSATIPFVIEERVITIRAIPAEICGDCGEAYMTSNVADAVQQLVERLRALEAEVSVARFRAA
ncbi:MAG: type II toxin-antitoxin system MqsA family antitoxin [Deltaproteobacteria bacterium]|nr:type II toxin-antitoxin system MqsA family antitoxin [Deltaproteobacteria bacterium]